MYVPATFIDRDIARFAWDGLGTFLNVPFVKARLVARHKIDKKHLPNAEKQAEHIGFCLRQAKEYDVASRSVSLATRPVLQYYSVLSLALAEILYKGDGNMSLDVARATHGHHGLTFSVIEKLAVTVEEKLESLRAAPFSNASGLFGTFPAWHHAAVMSNAVAQMKRYHEHGSTTGPETVLFGEADRVLPLPKNGVSFSYCVKRIPQMAQYLQWMGIVNDLIRANIEANVTKDQKTTIGITFHNTAELKMEALKGKLQFSASSVNCVEIFEANSSSFGILMKYSEVSNDYVVKLPSLIQKESGEAFFCISQDHVNEFGSYYLGLYMLGNYARYYQEKWLRDVDRNEPIALVGKRFMDVVLDRAPLLTLGELSETQFVEG